MSLDISNAFIKQFEREVHEAYQRMGSKLRDTVRVKNNVIGASTIFPIVGKGAAMTKARNGMVPTMNVTHSTVECFLQDYYAGDWVDRLDELKTDIDERQVLANAGAYALGRQSDALIISALDGATTNALTNTDGMTLDKVMAAFEILGANDVPDDGDRVAIVGWEQWSQLLQIQEFSDADYVGSDELPFNGTQAKRWLGTLWMPHSGLTVTSSVRQCHWYHRTAIGFASGDDINTDITWHGDRAAFFVNSMMSQGAVLIDNAGVVTLQCLES
jgi:hypothetical protein